MPILLIAGFASTACVKRPLSGHASIVSTFSRPTKAAEQNRAASPERAIRRDRTDTGVAHGTAAPSTPSAASQVEGTSGQSTLGTMTHGTETTGTTGRMAAGADAPATSAEPTDAPSAAPASGRPSAAAKAPPAGERSRDTRTWVTGFVPIALSVVAALVLARRFW